MNRNRQLESRRYIIGGVFTLVAIIYICRLFYMQVIDKQSVVDARNNAFRYRTEYPVRGYIYDRTGKLLLLNDLAYDLMVIPKNVTYCDTSALCTILGIDTAGFVKRMKKAKQTPRKESYFEKQISSETYAKLQEKMYRFQGFFIQKRSIRRYPKKIAAHLLGYIGEVNKAQAEKDPYYNEGDYIGISGIEKAYEKELRGIKGTKVEMVDVNNKVMGRYANGAYDTLAIPGKALYCTIDGALQEYGEKLMQGKRGSIVAIDPTTGEILCLVTSPTYDPNLMVGRERSKNYGILQKDTLGIPLFNRALMGAYPPGSVFKLIDALVGLKEGVLTPQTVYPCNHGYPPMHCKPYCHHSGASDLDRAISASCNSYFSYVFKSIVDHHPGGTFSDGYNNWRANVMSFGVGHKLGSDLPYELGGNVPTAKYYNKVFGEGRWFANTVVSLGIGQAELTILPVQMANVVACIANRGYYYTPHIIRGIGADKKTDSKFQVKNFCSVPGQYFLPVVDGMEKVMKPGGTGYLSAIKDIPICGKTGTAQNPHGADHAVFLAFAPKDNPKIAIACVVENCGFGGIFAAPIVSLMIEKYIKGDIDRKDPRRVEMEKRMMEIDIINKKNMPFVRKHH
ncbi:MAG TPA: penicillin-binding transpeptidase domain-containing protein [Bacteroidia bacterium]|jgi:penicillin-binding protein 2|nr:penicillin-binding transpeptidase domain-containing protein [Bacteroidia bacterium]